MEDENHAKETNLDAQAETLDEKDENKEKGELLCEEMCLFVLRSILEFHLPWVPEPSLNKKEPSLLGSGTQGKFHLNSNGRLGIWRNIVCKNVLIMFSNQLRPI